MPVLKIIHTIWAARHGFAHVRRTSHENLALTDSRYLHKGQGKIVRMIDYIIGRIAGEYEPGSPLTFRSTYKQEDQAFDRYGSEALGIPLSSVAHQGSQGFSSSAHPHKEHVPDDQPDTNSAQPSTTPIRGFTSKFEDIQVLTRTLYGPEEAEASLRNLYDAIIVNGGKEELLDMRPEVLKNQMNMNQAYHHLFGAPPKETNRRPPLRGHHVEGLSESARAKLVKIEEILTMKLKNDVAVYEEIERIIKLCNGQPKRHHFILDGELKFIGSNTAKA
jgi:hypothetical protein